MLPKVQAQSYIGVGGGIAHMHGSQKGKIISGGVETPIPNLNNVKGSNAVVSVFGGYECSFANPWNGALAFEGGLSYGKINVTKRRNVGGFVNVEMVEPRHSFYLDALPKVAVTETTKLYGIVGLDYRRFRYIHNDGENKQAKNAKMLTSFALGGGIETRIHQLTLGLQGKYYIYPAKTLSGVDAENDTNQVRIKPRIFTALLRVCYHF
jgi:opacity protein-like surface antigen